MSVELQLKARHAARRMAWSRKGVCLAEAPAVKQVVVAVSNEQQYVNYNRMPADKQLRMREDMRQAYMDGMSHEEIADMFSVLPALVARLKVYYRWPERRRVRGKWEFAQ